MKRPLLTSVLTAFWATAIATQTNVAVPRLVVGIVVDQLRSDYLETFAPLYGEKGLKQLMCEGVVFPNAQYASANVDRASSVASIYTGTVPYTHGIVSESWIDRQSLRLMRCVEDREVRGVHTQEQVSPKRLLVSTIGDELKMATDGKALVFGVAPHQDMALLSAGHAADWALWPRSPMGGWAGTSYYGTTPSWTRMLSQHAVKPNEWVTETAVALMEHARVGEDDVTDLLTLCYDASVEGTYQTTGGQMVELQYTYQQLDAAISTLLQAIERRVGLANSLVFLTSTGYEYRTQTQPTTYRIPTGVFQINRCAALLNMFLMARYGDGQYVEAYHGNQIYIDHKLLEQKSLKLSDVLSACEDFLLQYKGVRNVYTSTRLLQGMWSPVVSHLRNAYHPLCSGDLLIEVNAGWTLENEDESLRQEVRDSYFGFPILFFGYGLTSSRKPTPVTTDCIAPTVTHFMRIRAPNGCAATPLLL